MNIYDFQVKDSKFNTVNLSDYKGKVLLIVNTATECGLTPQYEGLQALYKKYKDKGFEILDFPCNQFGAQSPGSEEEIVKFCETKYNTTFKTFAKIEVNGENADALYKYLKKQKPVAKENEAAAILKERLITEKFQTLEGDKIKWNFAKFLIDKNGNVFERYFPTYTTEELEKEIENLL